MKILNISLSALKPSQYRSYVKGWNRELYEDLFNHFAPSSNIKNKKKGVYRLYFPLKETKFSNQKIKEPKIVQEALERLGFVVEDYKAGLAKDLSGKKKNPIGIGKLLKNNQEALKVFANDPVRTGSKLSNSDYMVVISRYPYDIAGMSTDRGWDSCQNRKRYGL